jgi:hypothetical protein
MATTRPFAYNPTASPIAGTSQLGTLAIGITNQNYSINPGGVFWWMGPDEDLGYVIAVPVSGNTQPTPISGISASVGFYRTDDFTDGSFIVLSQSVSEEYGTPQTFSSATEASIWLTNNGYWNSYTAPVLYLDASNPASYPGTGTTWYDISGNGNDVTMVNSNSITWNNSLPVYFSTGANGWFNNPSGSNLPTGNSNYTFIIWVQLGSTWNGNGLMSIGSFGTPNQSNAFRAASTNVLLNYWWANDLVVSTSVSPTNGWFNAVATYDGTTRSIWVNGTLVGSNTPVGHNVITSTLQIAKTADVEFLNGNVGEVFVYDRGLTSVEILSIWNATKSRYGL